MTAVPAEVRRRFPSVKGRTLQERFEEKYEVNPETGCWDWIGARDEDGYGIIRIDGKNIKAHRAALEQKLGRKLRPDELACHSCDNPPCVNGEHLWAGNSSANQCDSAAKGRSRSVKLTPEQVMEIRRMEAAGISQASLCRQFDMSSAMINHIVNRKKWKHLP